MADLIHEMLKAWHTRENEAARLYVDGMSDTDKLSVFVECQFKGLKDSLALIAGEIEEIHAHLHEALPIPHDED